MLAIYLPRIGVSRARPAGDQGPRIGQQIGLEIPERINNSRALLVYLSTTCHPCSDSVQALRAVATGAAGAHVQFVASLLQTEDESRKYLADNQLHVDAL